MTTEHVVEKQVPTFYFIGVTTSKSSIMKVFPLWMKEMGYPDVVMEGVDLKIHDEPEAYHRAVSQIKYDPKSLGALVTTHKIDLLTASRDLFEFLDPYAELCGDVFLINRSEKFGGNLEFENYNDLESAFKVDLHPQDLKNATAEYICMILEPIHQYFEKNPDNLNLMKEKEIIN